jgi:hypothetical protein
VVEFINSSFTVVHEACRSETKGCINKMKSCLALLSAVQLSISATEPAKPILYIILVNYEKFY